MMQIQIQLNGEPRGIVENSSLQGLVDELQLGSQAVAIAVNRQVVSKSRWNERFLEPGDRVEVVRAIGGG